MDRQGECPNCGMSWQGEDVLDEISNLSVFSNRSNKEIKEIASNFGYNEENKTKFSKVIIIEEDNKILYKCPNIRCGKIYDSITGEEHTQEDNLLNNEDYKK